MSGQSEEPQRGRSRELATKSLLNPRYALHRLWMGLQRVTTVSVPEQRNERLLYVDMVFQALLGAGPMSFVAVYLVRLQAADWIVGLESSLPALVTLLAVLPAGAFVQGRRDLVRLATRSRMMFRGTVGLMALAAFFSPSIAVYIVVILHGLTAIPGAVLNVSMTTIIGMATTAKRRPTMLSTRWAVHGVFAAAIGFAAGQWLDWAPFPINYQILFASAILAGAGSWAVLSRLKLAEQAPRPAHRIDLREMASLVTRTVGFRNFLIAEFVLRMGTFLPNALFSIYRVRELGSSDAWLGTLLTVERLLSVLAYVLLSRYGSHPRVRRYLWLGCIGVGLYPVATALAQTTQQLLLSAVIAGVFFPAMNIFLSDTLYVVSPEEHRPTFIASNSFVMNITAFVGPLLGTWLAAVVGIREALVVATIIRLLGALAMWQLGITGRRTRQNTPAVP
ncbi:MAG: MFS transporter [Chloroflexi bacterium]|nr:MFS transporter [Chloroflexota bacterium]